MVVPSFSPVTVHSLSQLLIFTGIFLQAEYLPACELPRFPSLLTACLTKCLCHIINHFICHARINADPEGIAHDTVGIFQSSGYAVAAVFLARISSKHGCLIRFPAKSIRVCTPFSSTYLNYLVPIHALLAGQKETKPARIGMLTGNRQDQYVSSVPASPAFRRAKLCFLRSTKDGNFSSCAQPIDACRSVAFKLYPKWEYTYLWS